MFPSRKTAAISGFVLICVLFAAVRFWRLGDSCLWFDEMFSVQAAEMPWGDMFRFLAIDLVHPPGFYVLLKIWIAIGGSGTLWVRALPVLFGCLSIVPFVLLCRELKQKPAVTLLALFLLAVNGSLIKYAQEVRMYTMLMCVSLFSLWLFVRFVNRGKGLAALVAVNIAAAYVHYYSWAFIGCEIVIAAAFYRPNLRSIFAMATAVFAAFGPWIFIVASTARPGDLGENIDWIQRPGLGVLFNYLFDLIEPFYFQTSSAEPSSIFPVTAPLLILILAAVVTRMAIGKMDHDERRSAGILIVSSLGVLAAAFAASWLLPYSVWGTRHLIIVVAPVMLIIANAVLSLPGATGRTIAAVALVVITAAGGVLAFRRDVPRYVWCGWEPLIADTVPAEPSVPLYTSENLAAYHAWFATRRSRAYRIHIVKAPEGEFVDREYFPPRGFDGIERAGLDDIDEPRVTVIYRREKPLLTDWLRLRLEAKGYTACSPRILEFGPSTLVRAEMVRDGQTCSR